MCSCNQNVSDYQYSLNDYNLRYYVPIGPTQFERGIESPMLELANERQFVMSQIGNNSLNFEIEHTQRVEQALQCLFGHFSAHKCFSPARPSSPHNEYLKDMSSPAPHIPSLPDFEISSPSKKSVDQGLSRNFSVASQNLSPKSLVLSIQNLVNPEPEESTTDLNPTHHWNKERTSHLNRKDPSYEMLQAADSGSDDNASIEEILNAGDQQVLLQKTLAHINSRRRITGPRVTRSQKSPRLRCPSKQRLQQRMEFVQRGLQCGQIR